MPDAADCQYDSPTTYTCSLKEHLTFPNGHELTSSDVKFSFDRMLRLKTPGGAAGLFTSVKSVSTPDDLTAVFNLKSPDARLPYLLTTTAASIVDEESYPANKLLDTKAIGSGPYQVTAYKPGEEITLAKFAGYHGPRGAQNDGVEISLLKDSTALYQAITTGKADLAFHGFGPSLLDKLRKSDQVQVIDSDYADTRFFAFHMKSLIARQPAVRRAIAQLIDRPAIAKKAYGDHVTPLYSVVPPGFGGQVDAFRTEYKQPSKAAATAILKDAGITVPVPLTVGWTPTQYGAGAKAEVIELKRQLEASGLFRVTLRSAEWPQYQQLTRAGAYDLFHAGWIPQYPDADDYLAPVRRHRRSVPERLPLGRGVEAAAAGDHRAERPGARRSGRAVTGRARPGGPGDPELAGPADRGRGQGSGERSGGDGPAVVPVSLRPAEMTQRCHGSNGSRGLGDRGCVSVVYCRLSTIRDDFLTITIGQRSTFRV